MVLSTAAPTPLMFFWVEGVHPSLEERSFPGEQKLLASTFKQSMAERMQRGFSPGWDRGKWRGRAPTRDLGSKVLDVWEQYFRSLILEEIKKRKGREGEKGGGKREQEGALLPGIPVELE